jgi:RNase P subunit RPR2
MNDEEFKKRLSEVAEWRIPKISSTDVKIARQKARGKGRPTKEQLYQEEHEQVFVDLFEGINPTYTPVVTTVKIQACTCDDCGKHCEHGRHTEITKYTSSRPHWRARCLTCGMNKNPNTGEWDLTNKDASAHWANWLRKTSPTPYVYKPRKTFTITPDREQNL